MVSGSVTRECDCDWLVLCLWENLLDVLPVPPLALAPCKVLYFNSAMYPPLIYGVVGLRCSLGSGGPHPHMPTIHN